MHDKDKIMYNLISFSPEIQRHQWFFRSERIGMVIPGAGVRR